MDSKIKATPLNHDNLIRPPTYRIVPAELTRQTRHTLPLPAGRTCRTLHVRRVALRRQAVLINQASLTHSSSSPHPSPLASAFAHPSSASAAHNSSDCHAYQSAHPSQSAHSSQAPRPSQSVRSSQAPSPSFGSQVNNQGNHPKQGGNGDDFGLCPGGLHVVCLPPRLGHALIKYVKAEKETTGIIRALSPLPLPTRAPIPLSSPARGPVPVRSPARTPSIIPVSTDPVECPAVDLAMISRSPLLRGVCVLSQLRRASLSVR